MATLELGSDRFTFNDADCRSSIDDLHRKGCPNDAEMTPWVSPFQGSPCAMPKLPTLSELVSDDKQRDCAITGPVTANAGGKYTG